MPKREVAVIGSGISGLTAAYYLGKAGHQVIVFDKNIHPGGIVQAIKRPSYTLDQTYNHQFVLDYDFYELLAELKLENYLCFDSLKTGFFWKDSYYPFTGAFDLLRFKPLTVREKFCLGARFLSAAISAPPENYDEISISDWLKLKQESASEAMFNRMCEGKFGVSANKISSSFLWGRFRTRAKTRNNSKTKENFAYLRGGLQSLISSLETRCKEYGVQFQMNCSVIGIERGQRGFKIQTNSNNSFSAEKIISTIPLTDFAEIKGLLSPAQQNTFKSFTYVDAITVCCGIQHSISPYYWLNLYHQEIPFVVLIEQTKIYPSPQEIDEHIIYLGYYCQNDAQLSEAKIISDTARTVEILSKSTKHNQIRWHQISRLPKATPVFHCGFGNLLRNVPCIPGVYICGGAFTYPNSRSVNSMINLARKTVTAVTKL